MFSCTLSTSYTPAQAHTLQVVYRLSSLPLVGIAHRYTLIFLAIILIHPLAISSPCFHVLLQHITSLYLLKTLALSLCTQVLKTHNCFCMMSSHNAMVRRLLESSQSPFDSLCLQYTLTLLFPHILMLLHCCHAHISLTITVLRRIGDTNDTTGLNLNCYNRS